MKYIAGLVLENFQSHAQTRVTFAPGLNVIVGPSDQGKTAIIRALRWALYNEPRGSEFVRAGSDYCRVAVTFSDGCEIVRERGPGKNRYVLRQDGQETVFEAVGSGVPPEIVAAHGMAPLKLDADHPAFLNLGGQLEGPFLLGDAGSMRAKAIGQVTGVHVLDAAIRDVVADQGRLGREEARLGREIEDWERQLQEFADLPEQERAVEKAGHLLAEVRRLAERRRKLADLGARWGLVIRQIEEQQVLLGRLEGLPKAELLLERAQALGVRLQRVRALTLRWHEVEAEIARWRATAAKWQGTGQAEPMLARIEQLWRRWDRLREIRGRWFHFSKNAQECRQEGQAAARALEKLAARYAEVLTRLGRCPTCGSKIAEERVGSILAEMFGGRGQSGGESRIG